MRTLFEHYVEHPELLPAAAAPRDRRGQRVTDYIAGMTDRYASGVTDVVTDSPVRAMTDALLHQGVHRARGAARRGRSPRCVGAMARYTREPRARARGRRHPRSGLDAHRAAPRGPDAYKGLCPFHDERTPSFGIDPAKKVYYCFGCQASGDVFTFVQETQGVDFPGALELLAERYGVELEREEEDPPGRAPPRAGSGCSSCSRGRAPTTSAACGSRTRRRGRASTSPGAGFRGDSAEFRVGCAPSAWDRVLLRRGAAASASGSCTRRARAALAARAARRTTAFGRGSCSRSPTCAGACSASGRARAMARRTDPRAGRRST